MKFNFNKTKKEERKPRVEIAHKSPTLSRVLNRLSTQEKIMFAKRLSILIKAGNPILDSLRMLKSQPGSRGASKIYSQIVNDVERGLFLSSSMGANKKIFGDFAVNVVRVGEMSGRLEENLNYLAEELKKKQELKRKVVGALVYPAIVVVATIALSIILTVFIFPKILPIFDSFKFELPFTTRSLIFVSGLFINYGIYLAIAFVMLVVALVFLYRLPGFRIWIDRGILKIPFFGRVAKGYHMANFCRTLSLLIKSQILVVEATKIASNTLNNLAYKREGVKISENVFRGEKMSAHFARNPHLFPPILAQMVSVGESSGTLSDTLMFVSDLYENEVDMLTKNLSTTLEPALMIVMGGVVGFIAVSIITPIYELTQHIQP